ncbi:MAG: hypothetical protein GQ559_02045 [Desulfobulbaceae bacterium]|nr:hypothetical protein [Desulfobulbaceae bacterium]
MMPDQGDEAAGREFWMSRMLAITRSTRQRDLALHLGRRQSGKNDEALLTITDLKAIKQLDRGNGKNRLYHQATDHFLRSKVEPFQAIFTSWMNGAKAQVGDQNIPFSQVVIWCQDTQDMDARIILTREVRTLCRFLAPFSHATWKALLEVLLEELHYPDYIAYCEEKRGVALTRAAAEASAFLKATGASYRKLVQPLLLEVTGLTLKQASRFDAIYLLGMRYLDRFFPVKLNVSDILRFFHETGYTLASEPELLIIHEQDDPGTQSYCIPVDIPGEIHILVGPMKGWLDLESLCHELGHAMTFLYTDAALPPEQSDFFQSSGLSESFAFLFQKRCMSKGFLHEVLGLDLDVAAMISLVHEIKWLTLARRYAAKLVIEVENFQQGYLQRGEQYYADTMQQETGFYYDPETYLFDLMPDFYTLDYFQAFLGSAFIEKYLQNMYGDRWYLGTETGSMLQKWWSEGNSLDLTDFIKDKTGQPLQSDPFIQNIPPQDRLVADIFSF